jgi:hypothetical protein
LGRHPALITLRNRIAAKQQIKWQIGSVDGPAQALPVTL